MSGVIDAHGRFPAPGPVGGRFRALVRRLIYQAVSRSSATALGRRAGRDGGRKHGRGLDKAASLQTCPGCPPRAGTLQRTTRSTAAAQSTMSEIVDARGWTPSIRLFSRACASTSTSTLRRAIISGEIPSGTVLNERQVAEELGVSTTPLKEALRRLEDEGLVVTEPRRGIARHLRRRPGGGDGARPRRAGRHDRPHGGRPASTTPRSPSLRAVVAEMGGATKTGETDAADRAERDASTTPSMPISGCRYLQRILVGQRVYVHSARNFILADADERVRALAEHTRHLRSARPSRPRRRRAGACAIMSFAPAGSMSRRPSNAARDQSRRPASTATPPHRTRSSIMTHRQGPRRARRHFRRPRHALRRRRRRRDSSPAGPRHRPDRRGRHPQHRLGRQHRRVSMR